MEWWKIWEMVRVVFCSVLLFPVLLEMRVDGWMGGRETNGRMIAGWLGDM